MVDGKATHIVCDLSDALPINKFPDHLMTSEQQLELSVFIATTTDSQLLSETTEDPNTEGSNAHKEHQK